MWLSAACQRQFVGRAGQRDLFRSALETAEWPFQALFIFGPGVIGKTTLLLPLFQGMPATGKHATWSEIHIGRFADGKLVEHWGEIDQVGMLQQLGLMPGP